ncbi:MAG: HesA/MoeB/ThiF family protein [Pseudohongiellaceae bacterium]
MDDNQLLRYSRQIMLPALDIAGQEKLLAANVLIVGAGGLGCPAAMYLACSGVGQITIADDDKVDLSNLQRQIAYHSSSIGLSKVASLKETMLQLNPETAVTALAERLQGETLALEISKADVVVDCSDNLQTRLEINKYCKQYKVPLVSGAAIRMEAQLSVFDHRLPESPCYQCLYDADSELSLSCSDTGVIAPLVGIVGAMQALECIKLICQIGELVCGRLLILDAATMQWREMNLAINSHCSLCHPV